MGTFLFDEIIFGPVNSRRLGVSLGINLLPTDNKICNFNCIYCECGWNSSSKMGKMPSQGDVTDALEQKLSEMASNGSLPDVITYAGNGEPTIHPSFDKIIDDTIELRNQYCPKAQIAVLSNATMLHSEKVCLALKKIERPILKLDSAIQATREIINLPQKHIPIERLLKQFADFGNTLIMQTLFLKAEHNGQKIDNTTEQEIQALLSAYKSIQPKEIMIYCIARDTPLETVYKIEPLTLDEIARKIEHLNIPVSISY